MVQKRRASAGAVRRESDGSVKGGSPRHKLSPERIAENAENKRFAGKVKTGQAAEGKIRRPGNKTAAK